VMMPKNAEDVRANQVCQHTYIYPVVRIHNCLYI
jgi:hypothetical protein